MNKTKMEELLSQFLDKMYPDYNESNEYLDNSTRAHRNGLRAGYTQGWKDCLKYSEEVKELLNTLQWITTIQGHGQAVTRAEQALSKFRQNVPK
jgi:hypothetical protein